MAVRLSAGLHGTAVGMLALHPAWWPALLSAVAGNHLLLGAAGMWPRSQLLGPSLHRLEHPGNLVALTFDDGPDPLVTPRVLDLLAAAGLQASFFCIGQRARQNPALLRRMVAEGHVVENHSHTHPHHFACLAGRGLRREIEDAQAVIADITGTSPGWFRAPMGLRNPLLDPALHRAGLRLASWSRRGYDTRCRKPGDILGRVAHRISPGDVLLLHDGNCARTADGVPVVLDVLPRLLIRLKQCGVTGVPLARAPGLDAKPGLAKSVAAAA